MKSGTHLATLLALAAVLAAALSGCASSGNGKLPALTPALAAQEIIPGKSTRADIEAAFGKAAITTYADGHEVWLYQLGMAKLVDSLPYVNLVLSSADNKKELSILFNRAGVVKKYQLMEAPL